jgi:hypothetical protein
MSDRQQSSVATNLPSLHPWDPLQNEVRIGK